METLYEHENVIATAATELSAGFEAALNGLSLANNPHASGSPEHETWSKGWRFYFSEQQHPTVAQPPSDSLDVGVALMTSLPIDKLSRYIGVPLEDWPTNSWFVAKKFVEAFPWKGAVAVYGRYRGIVSPASDFYGLGAITRHGWLLTANHCLVDPSCWGFEARRPYVKVLQPDGSEASDFDDYEVAAEHWQTRSRSDAPPEENRTERYIVPRDSDNQAILAVLSRKIRSVGQADAPRSSLSYSQINWLANLPLEDLGKSAVVLYAWLDSLGLRGLVPLTNWRRACNA